MTKDYLYSKTLYGVDIMDHLIRKEYPDYIMTIRGDECGDNPDPVFASGELIHIFIEKTCKEGSKLPERRARYHYHNESQFDGDALALAKAYWHERGEDLTEQQLIDRLAEEMFIHEADYSPYRPKTQTPEPHQEEPKQPEALKMPPAPKMSFYRRPIRNTKPCREASPEDIFKYLTSDYARKHTEYLRTITDSKARSRYKAENLDYITPGGIFRSRKESDLVTASGYMVIDFDHIPEPQDLICERITNDEYDIARKHINGEPLIIITVWSVIQSVILCLTSGDECVEIIGELAWKHLKLLPSHVAFYSFPTFFICFN